ncbi:hypothetical protein GA-1p42 [Bacillus phage GA1]|uniref:Uncharacterized protein n=1 Tax=Bacillus phage GA-1 TaxID=2679898 RepID=Q9FZV6_BPGA1|nr:hypothetical protein GA-1p42 [Bacillus phage GA1]CAC21540.1 hypothetical protein [Bacillus phage GA1]
MTESDKFLEDLETKLLTPNSLLAIETRLRDFVVFYHEKFNCFSIEEIECYTGHGLGFELYKHLSECFNHAGKIKELRYIE